MKISGWIIIVLVLLAAIGGASAAAYFMFFSLSDEEEIRKTLEEIRVCFLRDGSESPLLESVGRIGDLKKHLMPEVDVEVNSKTLNGPVSKAYLTQRAFIMLKHASTVDVGFEGVTVTLPAGKGGMAKVSLTAHVKYVLCGGKHKRDFPADIYFVKQKGEWLVCRVVKRQNESKQTDQTE